MVWIYLGDIFVVFRRRKKVGEVCFDMGLVYCEGIEKIKVVNCNRILVGKKKMCDVYDVFKFL